jgi:chromosome segregation ATPase
LRTEIAGLNKRLKEKDEEVATKSKVLDNILHEYRAKMQNLVNSNETALFKINELECNNKHLRDIETASKNSINELLEDKHDLQIQLEAFEQNIEKEKTEKKKIEEKNNNLNQLLTSLVKKIQDLFSKGNKIYADNKKIFSDLSEFFEE